MNHDEPFADRSKDSSELSNASLVGAVDTQGEKGREPWLLCHGWPWMIAPWCHRWLHVVSKKHMTVLLPHMPKCVFLLVLCSFADSSDWKAIT